MVEIKSIDQVGHMLATPVNHLIRLDILKAFGRQPFLNEEDLRIVVCSLRKHPVAAGPGGDDIEWNTEA
jgi:hypothetical protein